MNDILRAMRERALVDPSFRQAIHKKPTRAAISNVDLVYNYLHIRNQKSV